MTLVPPPEDFQFGYVVGRFLQRRGDTAADPDRLPDFVGATGTATFIPASISVIATTPSAVVLQDPEIFEIVDGTLVDKTSTPGVWLITGQYTVKYSIGTTKLADVTITVTSAHTELNPLQLAAQQPIPPTPTVKFVVNEQVYTDAIAARDQAVTAAAAATNAAATAGKSAYQIAVDNGFVGTEAAWLASLQGTAGTDFIQGVLNHNEVAPNPGVWLRRPAP